MNKGEIMSESLKSPIKVTFPTYRSEVLRLITPAADERLIEMAAMGLAGESGEFIDLIKKQVFHGHPADRQKLLLELGDIRWYMEAAMIALGTNMEEIERLNTEKLRKRYPECFSTEQSINRKE